jgi:hypothetical protein
MYPLLDQGYSKSFVTFLLQIISTPKGVSIDITRVLKILAVAGVHLSYTDGRASSDTASWSSSHFVDLFPFHLKTRYTPRVLTFRLVAVISIFTLLVPLLFWHRVTLQNFAVPRPRPSPLSVSQFVADGDSQCLPPITPDMIVESVQKHATCRKYSPFATGRARIALVTAHFGTITERYQKVFRTHLLHSLIHGNKIKVMCDPIIDLSWNKPAFILTLLMREMMKPAKERLEWIM